MSLVGSTNACAGSVVVYSHDMAPRKLHQQALYLEPEKAARLEALAKQTRIPRAVLLREAVDDLLDKYAQTLDRVPEKRRPARRQP